MVGVHFTFKGSNAVFFMASSHHQNRLFLTAYSNGKIHLGVVCCQTILSTIMTDNIQCLEAWSTIATRWPWFYLSRWVSQLICFPTLLFLTLWEESTCIYILAKYLTPNTSSDAKVKHSYLKPACSIRAKLPTQDFQTTKQLLCSQLLPCKLHFPAARCADLALLWRETYLFG